MDARRLSGILLIGAFVMVMLSAIIGVPGLYATQDINQRLKLIETYRTRWLLERSAVVLYALLVIAGYSLLALALRARGKAWLPFLAAVVTDAGTISGLYFLYLQTTDPRGGYSGAYPIAENLAYWLWLAGMLLFGVDFLRSGLPQWLGYLTAGAALVYGIVFLATGAGFATPFLLGLVSLPIGIVLLMR
jgi:hypothetical protein